MVDDFRFFKDRFTKAVMSGLSHLSEDERFHSDEYKPLRDLISSTLDRAGKGKDELVRVLGREIGLAFAAVLAEPLAKLVANRKLQITMELVERAEGQEEGSSKESSSYATSKRAKTTEEKKRTSGSSKGQSEGSGSSPRHASRKRPSSTSSS